MAGGIFPDSMFPVWLFTGFVFPQQTKPRILRREQESFVTGIRECPSKRFLHSLLSAIQREISSYSIYGKKYKKENGKVHCLTDISIRSEEHTSELQSHHDLVCRLLLEKNFFNDTATTEIYTLSLHDALPIF